MRGLPLALLVLLVPVLGALATPDVEELAAIRDGSRDRVIGLTDDLLSRFLMGRKRPYAVAIFFTAASVVESNPNLHLEDLRAEFGLAARAVAQGPDADKLFFFEAALETSQRPFAMLQVNALPAVVRISPDTAVTQATVEIPKSDKMLPETVGTRDYPWPAETFLDFLAARHGVAAAPVDRPSIYKSPLFPVFVLGGVLAVAYLAYQVYARGLLRHTLPWAVVSLAVFWFSTSGGMYNIIRGVPFFTRDRNGNLQFFLTSRRGQLGAEGFMLGSLYILVALSLALVTYVAPRIASRVGREALSYLGAGLAFFSLYQTFILWTAKTGYKHVFYF
ncbi:hypothetical protein GPECTOR_164g152 [Gonium pectorale]|uniref:Dolichyl-diphosphooligosaccharide--protein glycosyltransferase subunit 3 n=1 Tax=Gonium pectorale TaxID=33097 RepID=A0A150FZ27_GONPE|nr:hypothetical protein GPECTOR_164g152 [Gonium pectorale]|eukprot:KXZ42310.1 hypothetical protein GPECTOR_164g152 [Gonium pectorale]